MRPFLHFQVNPRLHQRGSPGHIESHRLINELKVSALRLFKPSCPLIGGAGSATSGVYSEFGAYVLLVKGSGFSFFWAPKE